MSPEDRSSAYEVVFRRRGEEGGDQCERGCAGLRERVGELEEGRED